MGADRVERGVSQVLPGTTVPVARASAGVLVALLGLAGWIALRWIEGIPPRVELSTHRGMYAYMVLGTSVLVAWFGYTLGRVEERLRRANGRLEDLATHDELTSLLNARVFHRELPRLVSLARRAGIGLALVVFDLDHFKRLNDSRGHAIGDEALAAAGRAIGEGRRREDVAARIGGEEMALILPGVDAAGARAVAERTLDRIRAVRLAGAPDARVTASAGVAVLTADEDGNGLFTRADAALYQAKDAGRDRVVCATRP